MFGPGRRVSTVFAAAWLASALPACEVTPEKIATWKETERGPKKLREAVANPSLTPALRGQALAALAELGMTSEALAEVNKASDAERAQIAGAAAPLLIKLTGDKGAPGPTTRVQREAKDALFLVRALAAPADRPAIDEALIAWTTADLPGRMTVGGQGTEKILAAIGPASAPRLIQLLQANSPALLPAAQILSHVADAAGRARGADVLIEQLRRSTAAATNEGLLQALGVIGGPHATAYLVDAAEHGTEKSREQALLSLAQGRFDPSDPAGLQAALRIAADKAAPGHVREAAFQVAEKVGAPAVPGLVKLMNDPDETVRWRAVEGALAAGKAGAIAPVLDGLSATRTYKKDDLDSYVVHDLGLIGPTAVAPLKQALASKSWLVRVVAIRGLAVVGRAPDGAALAALESDTTKIKGFPGNATIGSEAKAARQTLAGRP